MKKDEIQVETFFEKNLIEIKSYFSENKDKILEVLESMFVFLKQEEWINDCGTLTDVIFLAGDDFEKFISVMSLASECGANVHGIVENYIDWLISTTLWFSDSSFIATSTFRKHLKVDVRDVLINPLFKPLFALIVKMCKMRNSENLFMRLSDFCNFINNYGNISSYEDGIGSGVDIIDDEIFIVSEKKCHKETKQISICKSGFDKHIYEVCLKAFIKRADYEELEKYLEYIRACSFNSYNLSKYTVNSCESYYNEIISHIEDAMKSKINLQQIKKSDHPFRLLKEKYPNKSDIRLLSFMIKNKALENSARREIRMRLKNKKHSSMTYDEWYELVYDYLG